MGDGGGIKHMTIIHTTIS